MPICQFSTVDRRNDLPSDCDANCEADRDLNNIK